MVISFPALLALLLIGLKLCGVVTFSWFWVLLPLWIGGAIWLVLLLIAMAIAVVRK